MSTGVQSPGAAWGRKLDADIDPRTLPPGPSAPPWSQLFRFLFTPRPFLTKAQREFGTPFTVQLPASMPIVIFHEPEAVKEVFTGSPSELYAGEANAILRPFLGTHSVLVLDGDSHMRQRRLLLPPFRGDRMKSYGDAMIGAAREQMSGWGRGPMRLQLQTQAITLDVILRTVFGMEARDRDRYATVRDAVVSTLRGLDNPLSVVTAFQRDLGPWSPWGRFLAKRARMRALVTEEIVRRRKTGREDRTDVLSMLVEATHEDGEPMSNDEIRDELVTMLIAGHETTATALSWAFHRLSRHPEVLRKVQAELDSVYPDGVVRAESIGELTYLDAVAKETLRMHPVIPGVGRVLQKDVRIGGHDLPEGVMVACSILLAHMHPGSWKNPERYDPDRFLGKRASPYQFFPFGGGVRRCIGEAFALWEMRAVLATVLRAMEPVAVAPVTTIRRNITLTPSMGMPIRFRKR